jgi:hypothetical protein
VAKRTKHVFKTDEIPHLWAHQTQDSARNSRNNLYFSGDTIYSYGSHFPIARIVKQGKKTCVLFTTRSYSVTTSGHISAVRGAIPPGMTVFKVTNPLDSPSSGLAGYISAIETVAQSARNRKMETTRNQDVQSAEALITECKQFCKFFGLKQPKFPKLPVIDVEKLQRQNDAIKERARTRNERERAHWEDVKALQKAENDRWNESGFCKHTPKHDANKYGDRNTCERQTEDEEWAAKSADVIAAWRMNDPNARLRNAYNLPSMLRLSADKTEVETSLGVRVPVQHAKKALVIVRFFQSRQKEYVRGQRSIHLGHYVVDRITPEGTLHAGCHVIPFSEIERIGVELDQIADVDVAIENGTE